MIELRPGKLFGSFELQSQLDTGTTGATWLVRDYGVKRQADQAELKFLPDSIVRDESAMEKLKNEIRRRIALKHPNISRVFDLIENKGSVGIELEHVHGGRSLSDLRMTKPSQVFEAGDLERWIKELCEALEYAHKEIGLVGDSICPRNVIVGSAGELKLRDFGISNCIGDAMRPSTATWDASEMSAYKSPQWLAGKEPAISDDLYSLGATIYELLTGKPPFYGENIFARINAELPPSMSDRRVELGIVGQTIPGNWEETVAACLAKDPHRRPKSAIEVKERLQKVKSQSDILNPSIGKLKPTPPVASQITQKPWIVGTGIVCLLASASAVGFVSWHRLAEPRVARQSSPSLVQRAREFNGVPASKSSPSPLPDKGAGTSPALSAASATPTPEMSPKAEPGAGTADTSKISPAAAPSVAADSSPAGSPRDSRQELPVQDEKESERPSRTPASEREMDSIRAAVIKRIDALPAATAEKKASLVEKMYKARSIERLAVISFDAGRTALRRAAAQEIMTVFERPEIRDKLNDPTTILVIAGYADLGGREDINLRISQERAENVSKILKEQAKVFNALQTVGMGGTDLLDGTLPDQNRAVEVWAVVPF
jgi:serine/threonine protein kinase